MKVIILAGGKGTRLPESAKNIPKPLVKIAGKPILQHQIDLLEKHGLNDIRFSLNYKANQIIDYLGGKYEYVTEPKPLGTGGAIKFASQDLKNDFMVLNGDILSDVDFSEFIKNPKKFSRENFLGTILVSHLRDASDFGFIKLKENKILGFLEKPKQKCSGYVNVGFYILSPKIFSDFSRENFSREIFSIEHDIFPKLAENGCLGAYIHKGFWTDVGTEERLKLAKKMLKLL